jgi:hypothetical protein
MVTNTHWHKAYTGRAKHSGRASEASAPPTLVYLCRAKRCSFQRSASLRSSVSITSSLKAAEVIFPTSSPNWARGMGWAGGRAGLAATYRTPDWGLQPQPGDGPSPVKRTGSPSARRQGPSPAALKCSIPSRPSRRARLVQLHGEHVGQREGAGVHVEIAARRRHERAPVARPQRVALQVAHQRQAGQEAGDLGLHEGVCRRAADAPEDAQLGGDLGGGEKGGAAWASGQRWSCEACLDAIRACQRGSRA